MKYEGKQLVLETGIKKDWIITNGIGGYSSSTILGINTRKYHGLLVAPLNPPGSRHVILSKVDESFESGAEEYPLYSNIGKNYISQGYKHLKSFEKEYVPIFTYEIDGAVIKKFICMDYGKNTVCVFYHIQNNEKRTKLKIAPIIHFRDFHTTTPGAHFNLKQEIKDQKVKIIVNENRQTPIYMHLSEGKYIEHQNDCFGGMYYVEEEKRGQVAEENLAVPGVYEVKLRAGEEKYITFICSLEENIEELDGKTLINKEIIRITSQLYDSYLIDEKRGEDTRYKTYIRDYIIASDNFVVYRPSFALYTLIAGYPWFLDWGRDTLISFEGILLIPRRFQIAKEVLLTCIRDIKYGLVPNGYSGYDNRPLYNSVDASLLLFEQVRKYLEYTHDYELLKEQLYEILKKVIESYIAGIDLDGNNIHLDQEDYLLSSGTPYIQNTWMDAKIGDKVITPRNGKAVEINALWYNSLMIMADWAKLYKEKENASKYLDLAKKCKKSFKEKFYNKKRKSLDDLVGDNKIRPNQLFAIGLYYPILDPASSEAKEAFNTVTKKLLTPYGLKTLAKGEEFYREIYEGDQIKRDMSYHQGITWPWLLGIYADSLQNIIKAEKAKTRKKEMQKQYANFIESVEDTFYKEMYERSSVGSISEIYDSAKPYEAKGTFAQGWSVAEIFRIIINYHKNK
ncbi:MAG: glycogen debranching protein [Clostridia bacterium]|nr:glycogen debranching protein [Clostridia bacterium]